MSELVGHRIVDVGADEELTFDWSAKLGEDVLTESVWEISPYDSPNPLLDDSVKGDTSTSITVSGLSFGIVYTLTNTVQTEDGRRLVQSFTLRGTLR